MYYLTKIYNNYTQDVKWGIDVRKDIPKDIKEAMSVAIHTYPIYYTPTYKKAYSIAYEIVKKSRSVVSILIYSDKDTAMIIKRDQLINTIETYKTE